MGGSAKHSQNTMKTLLFPLMFVGLVARVFAARPPVPAWPDQFTIEMEVLVEQYGPDWSSSAAMYYDWKSETFRADFIGWCIPLFGSSSNSALMPASNDYTCSFLATEGSMFFVNHTASTWEEDGCCLFQKGLGCVPPDWMGTGQYNGTAEVEGVECDVWWFPGNSDPDNPCYGYWDSTDETHTPVRFFGITDLGPAILHYTDYKVGPAPSNVSLALPNRGSCFKECQPPLMRKMYRTKTPPPSLNLPWPSCG